MLDPTTRRIRTAVLTGALIGAGPLLARADNSVDPNPSILAVDTSLSAAYASSSLYFITPDNTPGGTGYFDSEQGNLKGVRGALSYLGWENIYARAEYTGGEGLVDYDAFLPGPVNATSRATMQQLDLRLGLGLVGGKNWMLIPYLNAGRRYWQRELFVGTPNDFVFSYSYEYVGLGNLAQYAPSNDWVLSGDVSFGRTLDPWVNAPSAGFNKAAFGPAPVVRVGLEADYRVYKPLHFFAGLDYQHYSFNQNGVPTTIPQAFSRTDFYTFTFGVRLAFRSGP